MAEQLVIFRDYQEQQAADHNDLQSFGRDSLDHVVVDAITASRRYSGFNVTKTAQTEVQVAAGRFYDLLGAVFNLPTTTVQSMLAMLPATAKRIVTVSAYGTENETDVEERDYLVDVATGRTEPRAQATVKSRDAVLVFTSGAETSDPQAPATPVGNVAIANILLDSIQVVSVTMLTDGRVSSTEALDTRSKLLETFRGAFEPRVAALASTIAGLQQQLDALSRRTVPNMADIYQDLADVKDLLAVPAASSDYDADHFMNRAKSDWEDAAGLGFDCKVEEGARFPDANADEFEIGLFSSNDPNATLTNGVLLPKFTSELKLSTGPYVSDIGIAQYGFQTTTMKTGLMSRTRLRYGGGFNVCSNGVYWNVSQGEKAPSSLYNFATWNILADNSFWQDSPGHFGFRQDSYWLDTWDEPFMYAQTTDHVINGALVAETVLMPNDVWATMVAFYCTQKAADAAIQLTITEVANGVPNPAQSLATVAYPHTSIVAGWNYVTIPPTFLKKGTRYGIVLVSNADHKLGLTSGQNYLDGTFFYSTDGAFFQGDLTKDLMIQIYGAVFAAPQVTIEFGVVNLDGGFRDIDILAECWVPQSTQLVYEIKPSGGADWLQLTKENVTALVGAPALAQFRGRFVGTRDMMPALTLTGSRVHVSRPKTAFKHVSLELTLAGTRTDVWVKCRLERFDDTPHDFAITLRHGSTTETPTATEDVVINADLKQIERTSHFVLSPGVSACTIIGTASTTSPANLFHVAERIDWATA